jgi:hypothetical protein
VLRVIKWLFIIALILSACVVFWVSFALWTGIYSVYSYPPSKEHPDGSTLLVSRDEGEPVFNSPDYVPSKAKPADQSGGMSFGSIPKPKRRPELRTIVKLPYIEWAYEKSLERPESN